MDPVTSLEIAAATAAFLEIGWEIVAAAWKIYRGSPDNVSALDERLGRLKSSLAQMKERAYPGDRLYKLSIKATELTSEMLLTLSGLSVSSKPSPMASFKLAIRRRLKRSKLQRFQSELEEIKADLRFELLTQLGRRLQSALHPLIKLMCLSR